MKSGIKFYIALWTISYPVLFNCLIISQTIIHLLMYSVNYVFIHLHRKIFILIITFSDQLSFIYSFVPSITYAFFIYLPSQ
jgi:hypothetical protein